MEQKRFEMLNQFWLLFFTTSISTGMQLAPNRPVASFWGPLTILDVNDEVTRFDGTDSNRSRSRIGTVPPTGTAFSTLCGSITSFWLVFSRSNLTEQVLIVQYCRFEYSVMLDILSPESGRTHISEIAIFSFNKMVIVNDADSKKIRIRILPGGLLLSNLFRNFKKILWNCLTILVFKFSIYIKHAFRSYSTIKLMSFNDNFWSGSRFRSYWSCNFWSGSL